MKVRVSGVALVAVLLLLAPNGPALAPAVQHAAAQDFSNIVASSRPAVFLAVVHQTDGSTINGTGFAVAGSSVLITAAHAVRDVQEMVVRSADGSVHPAKPIFVWHERDVALLRAQNVPFGGLIGRRSPVRVGEPVIVLGYPLPERLGMSQVSVTQGIVSAIYRNAVQLNIAINPGNSGGPVLDATGAVVGMVRTLLPGTGFAFAVPWDDVKTSLEALARATYPVAISLTVGGEGTVTGWIEQGTVLVDATILARLLDGSVFWEPETSTLTLVVSGKRLRFVEGSRYLDADGQRVGLALPMKADHRVPLKSVVTALGGSVMVDTGAFTAQVRLPGMPNEAIPPQTHLPGVAGAVAIPSGDPGSRELIVGSGTAGLRLGTSGGQVSKQLGPPTRQDLWPLMPGLSYRPLGLLYENLGISVLLVQGKVWAIAAFTTEWIVKPSGLRVGNPIEEVTRTLGPADETAPFGEYTVLRYKQGVAFWVRGGKVSSILVFQP